MDLIIQIKDGIPFQHPMTLDNFKKAFPDVDLDNLPSQFAWFERVPAPKLGPYDKNLLVTYELIDNVYKDVWQIELMTDQEKIEKQNQVKEFWVSRGGYASWIFNEELCNFVPPVPYPQDGQSYFWDDSIKSWVIKVDLTNQI